MYDQSDWYEPTCSNCGATLASIHVEVSSDSDRVTRILAEQVMPLTSLIHSRPVCDACVPLVKAAEARAAAVAAGQASFISEPARDARAAALPESAACPHGCLAPLSIETVDRRLVAYHDEAPPKPRMGFTRSSLL